MSWRHLHAHEVMLALPLTSRWNISYREYRLASSPIARLPGDPGKAMRLSRALSVDLVVHKRRIFARALAQVAAC